jgi:hypothetical protein
MRCRGCNTYFEAIRDEFDAVVGGSEPSWMINSVDDR